MQVDWQTISALGETKAVDVLLNFPVGMAIQRLLYRSPSKFDEERRARLDEYFGSPDWFQVLYPKTRNLFEEEDNVKVEQSGKQLLEWYRKRLKQAFGFASKAALIRNTRGGHLYYLLLASHKPVGVKIADHILTAGERVV